MMYFWVVEMMPMKTLNKTVRISPTILQKSLAVMADCCLQEQSRIELYFQEMDNMSTKKGKSMEMALHDVAGTTEDNMDKKSMC